MKTWEIIAAFVALFVVLNIVASTILGRYRDRRRDRAIKVVMRQDNDLYARMAKPEVTSCVLCERTLPNHDKNCPVLIAQEFATPQEARALDAHVEALVSPDAGDPLPTPPPPNIGGEGRPDYQGPHYESSHELPTRFVPYDMLGEPIPGTAVRQVGDSTVAGPLGGNDANNDPDGSESRQQETDRGEL